jgi:CRP/FNR family transcriptional regulator, cyclic AMP receptor protein
VRADQAAALLAQTELFGELDGNALQRVAEQAIWRSYTKGSLIFTQGDPGDSLFVLVEGLLKVVVTSEQGDEMVLVTLRPPATFGELALVDGRPRSASVEAVEPTTALGFERTTLLELIQRYPPVGVGLLRSLGRLLRRLTDQASDLVFLDLHGRVAKLLVRFAESEATPPAAEVVLDLHLTQGDLAQMVGGSRQSVNQILRSLASSGYLELRGRTIVIKELDQLRRRAGHAERPF